MKKILEDHLLSPHLSTILDMPNSGVDNMIDTDNTNALARLYRLFTMVPAGLPSLKRALKNTVLARGKDINEACDIGDDEHDDEVDVDNKGKSKLKARPAKSSLQAVSVASKWVEDMLRLKDKMNGVWRNAFESDREIESALHEVCDTTRN